MTIVRFTRPSGKPIYLNATMIVSVSETNRPDANAVIECLSDCTYAVIDKPEEIVSVLKECTTTQFVRRQVVK